MEICEYLIENGADVNAVTMVRFVKLCEDEQILRVVLFFQFRQVQRHCMQQLKKVTWMLLPY